MEGDTVRARLRLPRHLNGCLNTAHGGVLAGLLDETMGWAATVFGKKHPFYVTGELTIKYIAPSRWKRRSKLSAVWSRMRVGSLSAKENSSIRARSA